MENNNAAKIESLTTQIDTINEIATKQAVAAAALRGFARFEADRAVRLLREKSAELVVERAAALRLRAELARGLLGAG